MTYNAVKPPDSLTSTNKATDYNDALEKARAIAAKLGAQAKANASNASDSDSQAGVKRSYSEAERPPSSGYRRADYEPPARERDHDRKEYSDRDHDRDRDRERDRDGDPDRDRDRDRGHGSWDRNDYDRDSKRHAGGSGSRPSYSSSYGDEDGKGRQRYGLGSSERTGGHYGPGHDSEANIKVQRELSIPSRVVGLVIGRGGENLKRIERESNTKIQFSPQDPQSEERLVTLMGSEEDLKRAEGMIMEIVESGNQQRQQYQRGPPPPPDHPPPGTNTIQIQVPANRVGLVIGRGGETIHSLQNQSGAKITVTPDSQVDRSASTRTVTITGTPPAIEKAQALIDEIVNPQYKGGPGAGGPPSSGNEVMYVASDRVGLIIGRGGETVRSIQNQFNVRISIDPNPGPEGRKVTISGFPDGGYGQYQGYDAYYRGGPPPNAYDEQPYNAYPPYYGPGQGHPGQSHERPNHGPEHSTGGPDAAGGAPPVGGDPAAANAAMPPPSQPPSAQADYTTEQYQEYYRQFALSDPAGYAAWYASYYASYGQQQPPADPQQQQQPPQQQQQPGPPAPPPS
ncbi:hypothetical protein HK102_008158 [Quaeritorhiza haematococci]|nr:hypothetical protein HK102_008158 [Quaeritorhiza haematococci]